MMTNGFLQVTGDNPRITKIGLYVSRLATLN